jgi:hypothetical protein
MVNRLETLIKFIQYQNSLPYNHHFESLSRALEQFVCANAASIKEFEKSVSRVYDGTKYTDVIKSTMPKLVSDCCKNDLHSISNNVGVYQFSVYFASYHDGPFYEYSHEYDQNGFDLEDPQLAIDYPESLGWEDDEETGNGRRREVGWFAKDRKAFQDWIPVVRSKLQQEFPHDLIEVEYTTEHACGVEITIRGKE